MQNVGIYEKRLKTSSDFAMTVPIFLFANCKCVGNKQWVVHRKRNVSYNKEVSNMYHSCTTFGGSYGHLFVGII